MIEHQTFLSFVEGTRENIDQHVLKNGKLRHFFNNQCPSVKKLDINKVWHYYQGIGHLNTVAQMMLKNINKPRLHTIATYDKENKCYEFDHIDQEVNDQFNSSKLHWLVNDVKIAGLGYPPQGYMQHNLYVCHPGTYRYYAAFAQQISCKVSVWDTHDKFPEDKPMELNEWISFCSEGFIRQHRTITVETDTIEEENRIHTGKRYLEVHETSNHHDHCIFNNDRALGEMYNFQKPTIYAENGIQMLKIKQLLDNPDLYNFDVIDNPFLIPHKQNFKGVGIWVKNKSQLYTDPSHILLYLDTNDDIAVIRRTEDVIVFNCATDNCKKLIPEIVAESSHAYLNKYLWCSKVSTIPQKIGEHL